MEKARLPDASLSSGADRRLLLGPAGSGKSHRLREVFVEALRAGDSPETLLLVPTASYRDHTRNQVLREGGLRGFADASICTFRDLLERLAPETAARELSGARRELLIRRLLRELPLPYLSAVRDFPGFRASLAESLEEARRAGASPDMLEAGLRAGASSARHQAFVQLYRAYTAVLEQAGADDRQRLSLAFTKIAAGEFRLRALLLDGFADFTAEQRQLLEALLARTPAVQVALTLDPQRRDFFYQAERSRAWLKSANFREIWMEGNRRASNESLGAVERALREGRAEPPPPLWAQEDALALWAAADRRDEAELIAREILRLARSGWRYREIGIIARRPPDYAPLLRGVFRRLGIPLREFVPVSPSSTACGQHLRLCLNLFLEGSRPESLIQWLKSPYSTVRSRTLAEKFEYRAIHRLADARECRWEHIAQPGSLMAAVVDRLKAFDAELAEAGDAVALARWAQRVWREFTRQEEIRDEVNAGRALELRAEATAFRRIEPLLEEVAQAAAAEHTGAMSFAEFRELVLSLLEREPFALRDRRQDAVNLMNPFEARQWELRAVFVAGLVEKEFPAPAQEALFLDDEDRQALEQACDLRLPTAAHRALEERLLFYVAATRARERLYFTHPQSNAAGTPLLRSFFLRGLAPLLEPPACRVRQRRRSEIVCPADVAAGAADLLALAHLELGARWPNPRDLGRALALYERLRASDATGRAARALARRPGRLLLEASLAHLRETAVTFSNSSLGTFAECAFKHFAGKLLALKGPAKPEEIDFLRQGKIAHAAIEAWDKAGRSQPIGELLEKHFDEETRDIPQSHLGAKIQEDLRRWLELFAEAEQRRGSTYRTSVDPAYIELKFGDGCDTPPLQLRLGDGTVIRVGGRLDRVEIASADGKKLGLVLDFKYSSKAFSEEQLEHLRQGLDLQLAIYLLAVKELFGLVPAGAELYPLKADPPARCGVYDRSSVGHIFRGNLPEDAEELGPEQFAGLIEEGRRWIERHAEDIRRGAIAVEPKFPARCKDCDFLDLCRVNQWEFPHERELATVA